jgi:hypothetical protein
MQERSMHDWEHVTNTAFFAGIADFRGAEQLAFPQAMSKDCQVKRAPNRHDAGACRESCRP